MTRVFERAVDGPGTRLLIIGAGHYPFARKQSPTVPRLADIPSATLSATTLARVSATDWADRLLHPLASIDLLTNSPDEPDGCLVTMPDGSEVRVSAPTAEAVRSARSDWIGKPDEGGMLVFYCCGHGLRLPSTGRTFLTSSFGQDQDSPWPHAIALDDFALGMGEKAPRNQWLLFDCCDNTPPEASNRMSGYPDPLVAAVLGGRASVERAHGPLAQVVVASASPGAQAFGKAERPSRFMEALLEACRGSGGRRMSQSRWWIDQLGIEEAMSSYGVRVAALEEEDYFRFSRVTQTDAADIPKLMTSPSAPECLMLIRSNPAYKLKRLGFEVRSGDDGSVVARQQPGHLAETPFKRVIPAWRDYTAEVTSEEGSIRVPFFAQPPLVDVEI